MRSDDLLLLPHHCPPPDDAELSRFLELSACCLATPWVTLELYDDRNGEREKYERGQNMDGHATALPLHLEGPLSAVLSTASRSAPEPALVTLLSFALCRALEAYCLHSQAALLRTAFDSSNNAVLLFDLDGEIVYANSTGDSLLSRQTEDSLVVVNHGDAPKPLVTLLCSLVEEIGASASAKPSWQGTLAVNDGAVLGCEIIRIANPEGRRKEYVLAILRSVEALPHPRIASFSSSYRLSPREQEVLCLLFQGLSNNDIASRLGISRHTVRDHLKHLYRKTDTCSKNEMLKMVSHATLAPPVETP